MMDAPTRIAIFDEQQVLVEALGLVIEAQADMRLVGCGSTCAAGLSLARQEHPRVLLLGLHLPDGDSLELAAPIKAISPETNILIIVDYPLEEQAALRARQAGVSGFVAKSQNLAQALHAIRQAARGEMALAGPTQPALLKQAQAPRGSSPQGSPTPCRDPLTRREREILTLVARGQSVAEIAAELVIAPHTVRTHIRNLLQKLGLRTRLQAVTYALKHGLIEPLR